MKMRLLFAIPDDQSLALMHSILTSALELNPLAVETAAVATYADLMKRVVADGDDIVLLDWNISGADTSAVVEEILALNPRLRVVALLPMTFAPISPPGLVCGGVQRHPQRIHGPGMALHCALHHASGHAAGSQTSGPVWRD